MRSGRLKRWTGGIAHRVAAGSIGCLTVLLAAPAARATAQQGVSQELIITVRLVSEGGGPVLGAILGVEPLETAPDVTPGLSRIDAAAGVGRLRLRAGIEYRVVAGAPGHRERTLEIAPTRPMTLRIVLSVDPYELPAIVAAADGAGTASSVRSVHQVRFEEEALTYATVDEWLADVPGVSVHNRGPGRRQVLSVRGSRPEDVLVLLDGVPLNDPLTGRADLSMIPTSTLESGSLVLGAASQRYGSGASAGVLLLNSRIGGNTGVGGGVRVGSFGGAGLDVQADLAAGERRLAVSIAAERAENDFSFRNPVVPGGPIEVRSNADAASVHAALQAVSDPVHASLRFDRSERGIPGRAGTSLFESARAEDRTWIVTTGLDAYRVKASGSYGWRSLGYRTSSEDPQSVQQVRELRAAGDLELPAVPVTVGARLTRERVEGDLIEGTPGRTVGGARVAAALSAGPVRVDPALSLDVSGDLVAVSPELSATWRASSSTRIWGRVGQGFRLPTFGDLYFASQYQLRPNPGLQPERITFDSEAGASAQTSAGSVLLKASATAWARHTKNPIVWLASSVAVWSPRNLGELWATGLELVIDLETSEPGPIGWRAQLAGTVQRSRVGFGSNRNPLPYEPRSLGRLSLEAWNGAIGSRVDLRHTGSRTTSLAATRTLPGFTTVDVSARHSLVAGLLRLGLYLRVENLLDHRHQLVELFPEPGRQFTVRLEARRAQS